MSLVPVKIVRSMMVLESKQRHGELQDKVSLSFVASFADGSEKILNQVAWHPAYMTKPEEIANEMVMSPEVNTLYHKDWSNVVSAQDNWRKCYPKPLQK